jgi:hypothetical protein
MPFTLIIKWVKEECNGKSIFFSSTAPSLDIMEGFFYHTTLP